MESVFDFTLGKKAEDTTSGILQFLLSPSKSTKTAQNLRNFFKLPEIALKYSGQDRSNMGRFDLKIESFDSAYCAIIENKLGAGFTWSVEKKHQLLRYSKWLEKDKHLEKRLIVLCPKGRKGEIENEIRQFAKDININIEILLWEDLCKVLALENRDIIAGELVSFIGQRYLIDYKLDKGEVEMLKAGKYGKMFKDIMQMVDYICDEMPDVGKKKTRFDKDYYAYGFEFRYSKKEYWFGIWPDIWESEGCGFVLQKLAKRNEDVRFKKCYEKSGEPHYGYIYGFRNIDNVEAILEELKQIVENK